MSATNISESWEQDKAKFFAICKGGDLTELCNFFQSFAESEHQKQMLRETDENGLAGLHHCVNENFIQLVDYLLISKKANVNVQQTETL